MAFGLDYVTGPPIADMKAAHVEFVCRYVGYFSGYDDTHIATPQGKCLTPGEATALIDAGIAPVSNWEWDGLTPLKGYDAGVGEALEANKIHLACGGPASRPIYFSVDTDVGGEQVAAYFQGVAKVLGLARTGAYGSYRLLKYLFDNGLITWGWQTYAWSYGAWEPRAHIQQYLNGVSMSGHSVDYDRSIKSDFGAWRTQTVIAYNTPGVSHFFTEVDPGHWKCLQTGKILQGAILNFYKAFGGNYLCGLTHLGIPVSNEISLGGTHGAVKQYFEDGCVFYDPAHEFDTRPGEASTESVYLAKLYSGPGVDPKVGELETQVTQLQAELAKATQPTGLPADKVADRLQAIGIASHNGDTAIQSLVSQPIS